MEVVAGKPKGNPHTRERLFKFLKDHEGKKVWVTFDKRLPQRSQRANSYYWVYLGQIAEETGYTKEEVHEWAKQMFLANRAVEVFGKSVRVAPSTTALSTGEFMEYINKIENETNILAPDPVEAGYLPS